MRQPDREAALLARRQHQLATRRQLLDIGFTRKGIDHRVESGMFERLESGLYVIGAATNNFEQRVMAAVLKNPGGVASHRTAAYLLGLAERAPKVVEVSVGNGRHRQAHKGRLVHQARGLLPPDVRLRRQMPTTTAVRTVIDCAAVLSGDPYEEIVDLSLLKGLTAISAIRRHIQMRGLRLHHGVGRLLILLDDREFGVPERKLERDFLRRVVANHRLPKPVRQQQTVARRIDFVYPDHGVAIELDGRVWHSGSSDFQEDRTRGNELWLAGLPPLRFTWFDVHERDADVADVIRRALALKGR
jgi:very-short-patch-repair endonuclease